MLGSRSGTALFGMLLFKEPASFWRLFFLTLLIGSILGLKLVTKEPVVAG